MTSEVALHSNELEELLIATFLKGERVIAEKLIGSLDKSFFKNPYWAEIFMRVYSLLKQKSKIPSYTELLVDQTISDASREVLKQITTDPVSSESQMISINEQINFLLKKRKLYEINQATGDFLTKGGDLNNASKKLSDLVYQFNTTQSSSVEESIFRITEDQDKKLLREILSERKNYFIPTGFEEFDRRNKGLPRGGFTCVSATTGGGKSLIVQHMSRNMALRGVKVCLVSLEMTEFELMERLIANLTKTPLNNFKNIQILDEAKKTSIFNIYESYQEKIRSSGGREDYKCSNNDVNIEELLYSLKPFGYDVIIIDYLGLLKGFDGDDQWRKLSEAARFCKIFAAENNINIIACAQLSKEGEIRYSRGILEHANNSFSWVCGQKEKEAGIIQVEQKKCRMGDAFPFYLKINFELMDVQSIDYTTALQQLSETKEEKPIREPKFKKKTY